MKQTIMAMESDPDQDVDAEGEEGQDEKFEGADEQETSQEEAKKNVVQPTRIEYGGDQEQE